MLNDILLRVLYAAIPTVVVAILGSYFNSTQNEFYRGRDFDRDHGHYDGQRRSQIQEKGWIEQHGQRERETLRRHQEEEHFQYGNSDELRRHQRREWRELRQHRREEWGGLNNSRRFERHSYDDRDRPARGGDRE